MGGGVGEGEKNGAPETAIQAHVIAVAAIAAAAVKLREWRSQEGKTFLPLPPHLALQWSSFPSLCPRS